MRRRGDEKAVLTTAAAITTAEAQLAQLEQARRDVDAAITRARARVQAAWAAFHKALRHYR